MERIDLAPARESFHALYMNLHANMHIRAFWRAVPNLFLTVTEGESLRAASRRRGVELGLCRQLVTSAASQL